MSGTGGSCATEEGTALRRPGEDIGGQLAAWARHHGLGPEGGQFLCVLIGQGCLIVHPAQAALETRPALLAMSQPMVGHRQKEKVPGVGMTLAGG
jgi:hypothetical protein